MTIAEATVVVRWEEDNPESVLLNLMNYLKGLGLSANVVKIEVVE